MQLCFYKARYGNLWDRVISWFTKNPYSHVELRFSDGLCFSASPVESGVRFLHIKMDEKWDVIDIPDVTPEQEAQIRNWCHTQVGKGYDWFAIFGYVYGWLIGWIPLCNSRLDDSRYWYCSEICTYPLTKFGVLDYDNYRISPGEIYQKTCKLIESKNAGEYAYSVVDHKGTHLFLEEFNSFAEANEAANKDLLVNYSIKKRKTEEKNDWTVVSCNSKGCKVA